MKRPYLFLCVFCFMLQGCPDPYPDDYRYYEDYEPVFRSRSELDSSIQLKAAQEIVNSGKIYVVGDMLFVGEEGEGFHVFDNSDPKNPIQKNFIEVLASTDVAVRNDILYVNQATDLLTLQYDFVEDSLRLLKRIVNAFPPLKSPEGYTHYNSYNDSIIIDWKLKDVKK